MVICAYNEAEYVADAITSLLACRDPNLEIIVVDDGSCDDTATVMKSFASEPVVRYIAQANRGQAGAFNRGVAEAKGKLIGLADGDDFSFPHKLSRIRRWFDAFELWDRRVILRHPLVRFASTPIPDVASGNPSYSTLIGPADFGHRSLMRLTSAKDTQAHVARYGFWPFPGGVSSSTMMTRALVDAVFPLPEIARYCGDIFPILAGCLLGDLYATPMPLGAYRIHGQNHSLTAGRWPVEFWESTEQWLNQLLAQQGLDMRCDFFHSSQGVSYLAEKGQSLAALRHATGMAYKLRDRQSAKLVAKTSLLLAAQTLGLTERLLQVQRL